MKVIYVLRSQTVVTIGEVVTGKEHEGAFWGGGNSLLIEVMTVFALYLLKTEDLCMLYFRVNTK